MNEVIAKLLSRFKGDKRMLVIVVLGLAGIILLALSELVPEAPKEKTEPKNDVQSCDYEESLEKRLGELISAIEGAGKSRVMITLDSGDENIYATKDKASDKNSERDYVVVKQDGDENGMLLKVAQPEIRGVAVVCEGADSAAVRQEITNTVTAVLGVSTSRVNIAKMKKTDGG